MRVHVPVTSQALKTQLFCSCHELSPPSVTESQLRFPSWRLYLFRVLLRLYLFHYYIVFPLGGYTSLECCGGYTSFSVILYTY